MLLVYLVLGVIVCFAYACSGCWGLSFSVKESFFSGSHWGIFMSVDKVSLFILLMLLICFCYAFKYTHHYFGGGEEGYDLNKLISLFVAVMASLIFTGDFLTTLVFWEYLGVVSYFLIIFYLNYLSLRASVITLVSSRFGDVCLFLLIASSAYVNFVIPVVLLFFFVVMTKSAGFPFVSWLLEAMRAPTPVSSLVHSSTLVAAGIWFAMRYDLFLWTGSGAGCLLIFLLTTVFITGICCFFFLDLKKIVALSTCNNIAWCVIYLILGDLILSLFQLVSHGVSKCLLFMLVGDVMSGAGGSQSANCVYSSSLYGKWGIFSLFSIILGLSGVPYLGIFFTKHFLLTNFVPLVSSPMAVLVLFCMFLSYFYSFRLCTILGSLKVSLVSGVFFCCGGGAMTYIWLVVNYFLSSYLDECFLVSSGVGFSLIAFQLLSVLTAYWMYANVSLTLWSSSLFGCDSLVDFCFSEFYYICASLGIFFYRWDKMILSMCAGLGSETILKNIGELLNILMLGVILLITILCIWA
uniref:NADH:ubiquinone reductase (H(+)-translocating) n=1 Tax=Bothridium pithonis TaxID=1648426 RepID=A0A8F7CDD5_9CEST|nr:NADH dehydrogenase subunit 5 [Bothridium pithonis]